MMKKALLAAALAAVTLGASAHPARYTHYHDGNRVVIGNTIAPTSKTTYETDNRGRRIQVVQTTTCTETRVNRNNNHIRCVEREVRETRTVVRNETRPDPVIADRVDRRVERDAQGRRMIVTTTDKCADARHNSRGQIVCMDWDRTVTREYVRRQPRSASLDLNGDGRTDAWERLLYQGFRQALDDN